MNWAMQSPIFSQCGMCGSRRAIPESTGSLVRAVIGFLPIASSEAASALPETVHGDRTTDLDVTYCAAWSGSVVGDHAGACRDGPSHPPALRHRTPAGGWRVVRSSVGNEH